VSSAKLLLRPLEEPDIESLREWRNNQANTSFIRQLPHITSEMQSRWYAGYLADENEMIFTIEALQEPSGLIGSASLYDFEGKRAQFGKIMIGHPGARGRHLGTESTQMVLAIAFERLSLDVVFATVHIQNIAAICAYTKAGFYVKSIQPFSGGDPGTQEFVIEITKERYLALKQFYLAITFL